MPCKILNQHGIIRASWTIIIKGRCTVQVLTITRIYLVLIANDPLFYNSQIVCIVYRMLETGRFTNPVHFLYLPARYKVLSENLVDATTTTTRRVVSFYKYVCTYAINLQIIARTVRSCPWITSPKGGGEAGPDWLAKGAGAIQLKKCQSFF